MITITFPASNKKLAGAIGRALCEYSGGAHVVKLDAQEAIAEIEHAVENIEQDDPAASTSAVDDQHKPDPDVEIYSEDGLTHASDLRPELDVADSRVDAKNVNFNADFCGEAQVPFYASGKNKNQWKKRKGVTEDEYNAWYANALTFVSTSVSTQEDEPVNTAGAFGNQSPNIIPTEPPPKDCGEFMGWVSKQQAAEILNQHDITDAYAKLGLQVTDLFPPNDANTVAKHVHSLFVELGGLE